jgi:4-hydroxymandelate oxidase
MKNFDPLTPRGTIDRFSKSQARRAFLKFLAASPVMAAAGLTPDWADQLLAMPLPDQDSPANDTYVIKSVREALNVFDFRLAAKKKIPIQHFVFIDEGSFNQETDIANRESFRKYQIRLRRLTNFGSIDESVEVFGVKWESPLFMCPCASTMVYPNGDAVLLKAAKAKRILMIGQERDHHTFEDGLIWTTSQGPRPEAARLKELDAAGCPAYVWHIDHGGGGNQIGARAVQRAGVANLERSKDARCNSCHKSDVSFGATDETRITLDDPLNEVIGAIGSRRETVPERFLSWDDVKRTKDAMKNMKLILKGIVTREDAELAVKNGADGIEVTTHAGHTDASGRGAIDALPEVVEAVNGRIPVFVDSGFRSGADMFKGLALGAKAIGIGRPHSWALAAFGQDGVEAVIQILRRELQVVMAQTGSSTVEKISRESLQIRS